MFSLYKKLNLFLNHSLTISSNKFYSTSNNNSNNSLEIIIEKNTKKSSKPKTPLTEYAICENYLLPFLQDFYLYDMEIDQWYQYNLSNSYIWEKIDDQDFKLKIINLLKNHPEIKNNIRMSFLVNVISFLKTLLKSNLRGYSKKNLHLIPFNNGVLNLKTSAFLSHSSGIKFTSKLNINYNPKAKMQTDFVDWLLFISNGSELFLRVMRNFLFLVLTRNNSYHVALYLHGPAGTGKSLFEKLLISIVSQQSSVSTDLRRLNNSFETAKLIDKNLLLLSDIDDKVNDVNKLKLIISGDLLAAEKKFQAPFEFFPTCLVIITSNFPWQPTDTSSGIMRRILYLPFSNIPPARNPEFFYLDPKGYPQGILASSLPGFINWILTNPQDQLSLFSKDINSLNNSLSPNMSKHTNPFVAWAAENLAYSEGSFTSIGNNKKPKETHLFPNYLEYCRIHGFRPISFHKFSYSLIDICINSLGWKGVFKKETTSSVGLVNIIIDTNPSNKVKPVEVNKVSRDYFEGFLEGMELSSDQSMFKGLPESESKHLIDLNIEGYKNTIYINNKVYGLDKSENLDSEIENSDIIIHQDEINSILNHKLSNQNKPNSS